jgi:hypothetical protein
MWRDRAGVRLKLKVTATQRHGRESPALVRWRPIKKFGLFLDRPRVYFSCPGCVDPVPFMLLDLVIQTCLLETKNSLSVFHLQFCSQAI